MSDSLSRIEAILASKQPGAAPYTGVPQSRLEEELLETDFSKPTKVVESFSEMTEEGQVYAIRNTEEGEYNSFTEYILVDGFPERIGKQDVIVDAYTRAETDSLLDGKVDKVSGKGLSTEDFTSEEKTKLTGIEAGAQVNPDLTPYATSESVNRGLSAKVDKVSGKGLSSNDYTDAEKEKLSGLDGGSSLVTAPYTIRSNNWNGRNYSLESDYPSSGYDIVGLYPINGVTTEAMENAWNMAKCYGYSSSNVITARGAVPTIDITLEICVFPK